MLTLLLIKIQKKLKKSKKIRFTKFRNLIFIYKIIKNFLIVKVFLI